MPYKSDSQRRWAHTEKGTEALGGKEKVSEWDAASKGKKLPEKAPHNPLKPHKSKSLGAASSITKM